VAGYLVALTHGKVEPALSEVERVVARGFLRIAPFALQAELFLFLNDFLDDFVLNDIFRS
jgi:hypothetical protein